FSRDWSSDVCSSDLAAGDAFDIPNVGDGRRQLDVAHPLPAHLGLGDLHAAAVAHNALVTDPLVLAAMALPVLDGTEDLLAEQARSEERRVGKGRGGR